MFGFTTERIYFLLSFLVVMVFSTSCNDRGKYIFLEDVPPPGLTDGGNMCINFDRSTNSQVDLITALKTHPNGSLYAGWLELLKIEDIDFYNRLLGEGEATVMVPQNSAIENFLEEYPEIEIGSTQFFSVVKHQVMMNPIEFRAFNNAYYPAMNREMVQVVIDSHGCIYYGKGGQARVILADDFCSNGIIHFTDKVAIPSRNFR